MNQEIAATLCSDCQMKTLEAGHGVRVVNIIGNADMTETLNPYIGKSGFVDYVDNDKDHPITVRFKKIKPLKIRFNARELVRIS